MDEEDFDDEDLDEELDEEESDEEEQEEIEDTSDEEKQAEERLVRNKLRLLLWKVKSKKLTNITDIKDTNTIKKAKKMGKFKKELASIEVAKALNAKQKISAVASAGPALYYVAIGVLILLAVMILMAVFSSVFSSLSGGEEDATGKSFKGVTGTDFYGVRVAYQNESLASTQIIEDYVNLVVAGAENVKQTTTVSVGGTQYALQLTLNFEIPTGYEYANFEESSFSTNYGVVYNASFEIAKIIYKIDNETDFVGSSLIDCAKGIKYFGYADVNTIAETTAQILLDNTTIKATKDSEDVTDSSTLENIKTQIQQDVVSEISAELSTLEVRAEKLFVKDIILTGDEMVSGITKENYVYYMFMPNKQVNFTSFVFALQGQDFQNFQIEGSYNGTNYEVITDGQNFGNDTNFGYLYLTGDVNITVNAFADIDTNNLQALSEAQSIFDIITNQSLNTELYLQLNTVEELSIYGLKTSGFTITTSNSSPFIISEFTTIWK